MCMYCGTEKKLENCNFFTMGVTVSNQPPLRPWGIDQGRLKKKLIFLVVKLTKTDGVFQNVICIRGIFQRILAQFPSIMTSLGNSQLQLKYCLFFLPKKSLAELC